MSTPAGAPVAAAAAGCRFDNDVIVVGAGIMGSCTGHAAAASTCSTTLAPRTASPAPIRDAYPKAQYPPTVRLSRRLWADAEAESGYRVLTPAPQLSMGPRSNALLLAAIRSAGAEEVDFRVPDGWVTAASEHGGGVLNATNAVAMLQALATKKGAVVRDKTEIVDIRKGPEGGVVVATSAGEEFHGAKCVVTVGAWTSKLVRSVAGLELPIQPLHTMVLYWSIKPGREGDLAAESGFPTFSSYGDPHVYSTPSLELPGLIKINYDGGPQCDPDSHDWASGGGDVADRVARWIVEEFMPDADGAVIRQSCMYSMTPDKDFVIDFLGGEFGEDVVVGAGFSGHGFKMGPAVGRILAEMAIDGNANTAAEADVELGHFRISRFETSHSQPASHHIHQEKNGHVRDRRALLQGKLILLRPSSAAAADGASVVSRPRSESAASTMGLRKLQRQQRVRQAEGVQARQYSAAAESPLVRSPAAQRQSCLQPHMLHAGSGAFELSECSAVKLCCVHGQGALGRVSRCWSAHLHRIAAPSTIHCTVPPPAAMAPLSLRSVVCPADGKLVPFFLVDPLSSLYAGESLCAPLRPFTARLPHRRGLRMARTLRCSSPPPVRAPGPGLRSPVSVALAVWLLSPAGMAMAPLLL
ncbi:hypothetical protein HU200_046861 [Digitaria exilis]|uniref:FAD dependent oxidoreductase domain-containing protein n=1 Tax=Digitaria exilis TaxID=1010633 RepID=A0A835B3L2_9POAL|nr:hypothetical protein HU200_046861 [Digitaria exilis]